jgi:hypothetical protein
VSKDKCEQTAWYIEVEEGHFKILMKLWGWAKELNLKPEEFRNELFSKYRFLKMLLSLALKPFVHKATTKHKAHKPPSKLYSLTLHTSQPFVSNDNEASEFHSDLNSAVTAKEEASTVVPPFSGGLTVDTELKLSHDHFK